jgi:hydrogenase maturation protease
VIRVIGCGNPEAGDDAVGLEVVRLVRDRLADAPDVEVAVAGTGARALDFVMGADAVVVVDAVRTPGGERPPGTPIRVDVGPDGLPVEIAASLSSHGLGLAEVFGLSAAMGCAPRMVFVGVEAHDMIVGHGLSREVGGAIGSLVDAVLAEVHALRPAGSEPPRMLDEVAGGRG